MAATPLVLTMSRPLRRSDGRPQVRVPRQAPLPDAWTTNATALGVRCGRSRRGRPRCPVVAATRCGRALYPAGVLPQAAGELREGRHRQGEWGTPTPGRRHGGTVGQRVLPPTFSTVLQSRQGMSRMLGCWDLGMLESVDSETVAIRIIASVCCSPIPVFQHPSLPASGTRQ